MVAVNVTGWSTDEVDGTATRTVVVVVALTNWTKTEEVPSEKFASDEEKLAVIVCVPAEVRATGQFGTTPPDNVLVQRTVLVSVSLYVTVP